MGSPSPRVMGLTQNELDSLIVSAEDSEDASEPHSPEGSEAFLLRVRRTRRFLGDEAADALVLDALSKVPEANRQCQDASEETGSTASGSNSLPGMQLSSGLSQAELDALSICEKEESVELIAQKVQRKEVQDLCIETM